MKILHCSDLHFSQDAIHWINDHKSKYDVICLTGDFLDDSEYAKTSVDEQVKFFTDWFTTFEQPLLVCSGNHDYKQGSLSWLTQRAGLLGDGTKTNIQGITFGCIGYEAENFEAFYECDVVLYHVPPSGSSCAKESGDNFGCLKIKTALKQSLINTKYLLCGHVHKPRKHAIRLGSTVISNSGGIHKDNKASHAVIEVK